MSIHPTAVVHSKSEVDSSVVIGPYAVIHQNVKIASGTSISSHAVVGPNTSIGADCEIYSHACVGSDPQDKKYKKGDQTFLEIGKANVIREFVTLNRSTAKGSTTRIGNGCLFMAYSHVAHNCVIGDYVIMANCVALAGHVIVQDHAIIGGLSGIHQFCRIGRLSLVGGCSKVVQDVPPFMISDGNPSSVRGVNSIGLKRNNMSFSSISQVKKAYQILFRSNKNLSKAIQELKAEDLDSKLKDELIRFIESSERGMGV